MSEQKSNVVVYNSTAKKGGRPSAFTADMLRQAKLLCERGYTDVELAEFFGVCEKTLNNWKKAHPEFLQSLKEGKAVADDKVQRSLFERALDTPIRTFTFPITRVRSLSRP